MAIEFTGYGAIRKRIAHPPSTTYGSLFGADGVLKGLVYLNLDTSFGLLLLCTISSNDPLGLSKISPDDLRMVESSGLCKIRVVRPTNLCGKGLQRSSLHRIDREFVVRVNCGEASRNLIRERKASQRR